MEKESIKTIMDNNIRLYNVAHESNDRLNTRAYNLLNIVGLIIALWSLTINYVINDNNKMILNNTITTIFEIPIKSKTVIIIIAIFSVSLYFLSLEKILKFLNGAKFQLICPREEEITEYGNLEPEEVYEIIANTYSTYILSLRNANKKKSSIIQDAVRYLYYGIITTLFMIIIILAMI